MTKVCSELGVNWQGDYDTLIELTDMAFRAGSDYVKLQIRTPELCVPKDQHNLPRNWFDGTPMTYIEYRRRMELPLDKLREYDDYVCRSYGDGRLFSSVWDIPALTTVASNFPNWPYVKIPSAMLTNRKLLQWAIERGKPVIMSTGMSTVEEIDEAVALFPQSFDLTVMHCNSAYPVRDDSEVDLAVLQTYRKRYGRPVAFSSHHPSPFPAIYSAFFGAEMVELHLTLDRTMQGSDHASSQEEHGLELVCRELKRIPKLIGDGTKKLYESELPARKKLRGT
jgi:N-acetylneuraminate synthase